MKQPDVANQTPLSLINVKENLVEARELLKFLCESFQSSHRTLYPQHIEGSLELVYFNLYLTWKHIDQLLLELAARGDQ